VVDSSYEDGRIKVLDQQLRAAGEGNAPAR
jgi:hypothetical protein